MKTIFATPKVGFFRVKRVPLDPEHLGSGGGKNRLGLPFNEIDVKRAFCSVGVHKWFLPSAAHVQFNWRPVATNHLRARL